MLLHICTVNNDYKWFTSLSVEARYFTPHFMQNSVTNKEISQDSGNKKMQYNLTS